MNPRLQAASKIRARRRIGATRVLKAQKENRTAAGVAEQRSKENGRGPKQAKHRQPLKLTEWKNEQIELGLVRPPAQDNEQEGKIQAVAAETRKSEWKPMRKYELRATVAKSALLARRRDFSCGIQDRARLCGTAPTAERKTRATKEKSGRADLVRRKEIEQRKSGRGRQDPRAQETNGKLSLLRSGPRNLSQRRKNSTLKMQKLIFY
jgi:hypothetical protein